MLFKQSLFAICASEVVGLTDNKNCPFWGANRTINGHLQACDRNLSWAPACQDDTECTAKGMVCSAESGVLLLSKDCKLLPKPCTNVKGVYGLGTCVPGCSKGKSCSDANDVCDIPRGLGNVPYGKCKSYPEFTGYKHCNQLGLTRNTLIPWGMSPCSPDSACIYADLSAPSYCLPKCNSTHDCPNANSTCINGARFLEQFKTSTDQCGPGMSSISGICRYDQAFGLCVPKKYEQKCTSDDYCMPNQKCQDGKCVESSSSTKKFKYSCDATQAKCILKNNCHEGHCFGDDFDEYDDCSKSCTAQTIEHQCQRVWNHTYATKCSESSPQECITNATLAVAGDSYFSVTPYECVLPADTYKIDITQGKCVSQAEWIQQNVALSAFEDQTKPMTKDYCNKTGWSVNSDAQRKYGSGAAGSTKWACDQLLQLPNAATCNATAKQGTGFHGDLTSTDFVASLQNVTAIKCVSDYLLQNGRCVCNPNSISNCKQCTMTGEDAATKKCTQCSDGLVPSSDGKSCVNLTKEFEKTFSGSDKLFTCLEKYAPQYGCGPSSWSSVSKTLNGLNAKYPKDIFFATGHVNGTAHKFCKKYEVGAADAQKLDINGTFANIVCIPDDDQSGQPYKCKNMCPA